MVWLSDADIKAQCTPPDLAVLSQSDESTKTAVEKRAIGFFRGFLKRYDVDAVFTGTEHDAALEMFLIDYFIYILYSTQPDRLIPDMRVRRRDEVIDWLKGVQKGEIIPDLPLINSDDEEDINSPIKWGGNKRVSSNW